MFSRIRNLTFVVLSVALALTACGGKITAPAVQNTAPTALPAANNGEGGRGGWRYGSCAGHLCRRDARLRHRLSRHVDAGHLR